MTDTREITLALDASTYTGTVAVLRGSDVLAERAIAMRGEREERLMPAVDDALREAGIAPADIARIVCGSGPGSFTSLRIAASIAKGMAVALDVPLYAVSSLWLVIAGSVPLPRAGRYEASLDALRGERFVQTIEVSPSGEIRAIDEPRRVAASEGAHADDRAPHARGVARLDLSAMRPVDLATWEPTYGRLAEAQVKWEAAHGRPLTQA